MEVMTVKSDNDMKRIVSISLFVSLLLSCSYDADEVNDLECCAVTTIYASSERIPDVKTIIDNGTLEIDWVAQDAINVFFGASPSSRFVTSQSGPIAQFRGSIDVVTGGGEGLNDDTSLWGVYPYSESTTCDGSRLTMTLPDVQEAAENTFANGLYPQIARSWNFYMSFYNLCAGIRFSVKSADIRKVVFEGNNDEYLSGRVKVAMEGKPIVDEIISGDKKIIMYAPDNGYFTPGAYYYLVIFPTEFTKGIKMTYYKDNTYASFATSNIFKSSRGGFAKLTDRDKDLTFVTTPLNDWEEGEKVEGDI